MSKIQFFKYPSNFTNWEDFRSALLDYTMRAPDEFESNTQVHKDYLFSTMLYLGFNRPFYRIWPDVISMFTKMNPSQTRDITLPEPALTIEIPSSAGLRFSSIFVSIKNVDAFTDLWRENIGSIQYQKEKFIDFIKNRFNDQDFKNKLINHQKHNKKDFLISLFYPPYTIRYENDEWNNRSIHEGDKYVRVFSLESEDLFIPYNEEGYRGPGGGDLNLQNSTKEFLKEDLQIAFHLITGISIIAADPNPDSDMFEPVILTKDQKKLKTDKSNIIELSQKAIRRTRTKGFEIGKGFHQKSQNNPTYAVGAHFQHYWIGKKNSPNRQKIYKLRRGYVAGTKNLKKVPTGYYSEKSE